MFKKVTTLLAIAAASATIAVATPTVANAEPHPTYTAYTSLGQIRALGSHMCLEIVSVHPNQKIDWAPCVPGDPLQTWYAQAILGNVTIFLVANPGICIDGNRQHGEYVYSYNCSEHTPIDDQMFVSGGYKGGAQNSFWSAYTGLFITFHGGVGPAAWSRGRNIFLRPILGAYKDQRMILSPWVKRQAKSG